MIFIYTNFNVPLNVMSCSLQTVSLYKPCIPVNLRKSILLYALYTFISNFDRFSFLFSNGVMLYECCLYFMHVCGGDKYGLDLIKNEKKYDLYVSSGSS